MLIEQLSGRVDRLCQELELLEADLAFVRKHDANGNAALLVADRVLGPQRIQQLQSAIDGLRKVMWTLTEAANKRRRELQSSPEVTPEAPPAATEQKSPETRLTEKVHVMASREERRALAAAVPLPIEKKNGSR